MTIQVQASFGSLGAAYFGMPKRSSKKKPGPEDLNELAASIVGKATSENQAKVPEDESDDSGKNPAAVALGRLGGKKGGPARAKKLTAARRSEIAKKAAKARWNQEDRS